MRKLADSQGEISQGVRNATPPGAGDMPRPAGSLSEVDSGPTATVEQFEADANARGDNKKKQAKWIEWLRSMDTWWAIVLLLFGVTGVLGLPLLWVSRSFNTTMKVVLSILVTLYTLSLIGGVVAILTWAFYVISGQR